MKRPNIQTSKRRNIYVPRGTAGFMVFALALLPLVSELAAQEAQTNGMEDRKPTVSPHALVRDGNRLLRSGDAPAALRNYQRAGELIPHAREVAFLEGLAHFDLKEFDQAREAFERAGPFENDAFADDILYSLGAADHAEALEKLESSPQEAVGLLENAMHRYRDVLSRRGNHQAARDANFKAASMWKQLKQMMQQQQQQQNNPSDQQDKQKDQEQQNQEQQQEQSQQQEQESKPDQQDQSLEQEEQQQENQSSSADTQEQQKESEGQTGQPDENEEPREEQQASAEKREEATREQAERRLRSMMQAIRDRQKRRPTKVEPLPIKPVEKDW